MGDIDDETVLCAIEDGVAVLTLNGPEQSNGWTGALAARYFALLEEMAKASQVRAIVVTGAGRAFSVGGDGARLSDVADASKSGVSFTNRHPYWFTLRIAKPVIAAVNGACFGIGLQQALCCDIRIAADDAKFSTAYARRGLCAEYGMSWLLPRIVGHGHAMDMLLSGRLVRAAEAERMALVNRVVAADVLVEQAIAYARELATLCAPSAMAAIKRQVLRDWQSTLPDAYAAADSMLAEAMAGDAFREGVASWQERRAPDFMPLAPDEALLNLP